MDKTLSDRPSDHPSDHPSDQMAPQNSHWSKDRLHADVNRAVGGPLNLLRELSRISHEFDSSIEAEWMMKRIQFFSYELGIEIDPKATESERLAVLNRFFFTEKAFRCVNIAEAFQLGEPNDAYRLSRVLTLRAGSPTVLAILYAFLADRIGVTLDFVDLKPTCFLRWCENGHAHFIDITRSGSNLSSDELIETLHTRFRLTSFCHTSLLETFSFETYLVDYVTDLKRSLGGGADPENLLFLQNVLISYQPSHLHLLGERALLNRRLGNFKSALADLKRYFAFHDRAKAPDELKRLYDELVLLLDRNRSGGVEVLD